MDKPPPGFGALPAQRRLAHAPGVVDTAAVRQHHARVTGLAAGIVARHAGLLARYAGLVGPGLDMPLSAHTVPGVDTVENNWPGSDAGARPGPGLPVPASEPPLLQRTRQRLAGVHTHLQPGAALQRLVAAPGVLSPVLHQRLALRAAAPLPGAGAPLPSALPLSSLASASLPAAAAAPLPGTTHPVAPAASLLQRARAAETKRQPTSPALIQRRIAAPAVFPPGLAGGSAMGGTGAVAEHFAAAADAAQQLPWAIAVSGAAPGARAPDGPAPQAGTAPAGRILPPHRGSGAAAQAPAGTRAGLPLARLAAPAAASTLPALPVAPVSRLSRSIAPGVMPMAATMAPPPQHGGAGLPAAGAAFGERALDGPRLVLAAAPVSPSVAKTAGPLPGHKPAAAAPALARMAEAPARPVDSGPRLVWRRATSTKPQDTAAGAAQLMRSADSMAPGPAPAAPASADGGGGSDGIVATAPGRAGLDLQGLAERVARLIVRGLDIERERRGGR